MPLPKTNETQIKDKETERLVIKRYVQYRKIDKIEDKELCRKQSLDGIDESLIDISIFDKLDNIIDGECDCQSINDKACVDLIEDKFDKQDAVKVAEKFSLEFPLDDILEGLNVELEHKDITGGDLEETARIVIAHLKERGDYYKKLKKYVETKDEQIEDLDVLDEYTIGTVREWKGGKYKKIASGEWEKLIEKNKTEKQEEQTKNITETKEFKDWFGDSKIVDKNGKPLIVYHGTNKKFNTFKEEFPKNPELHTGFWFTSNKKLAEEYGEVTAYYIKSSNPIFNKDRDTYQENGFDSYIYTPSEENNLKHDFNINVLNPNQIKAVENKGTFNSNSNNIYDYKIIYDEVSIHNKKATIMRDGYYKYLAGEVDRNANYPRDIVTVYRPPEEVKKAYDRFCEIKRLPAIANHPESDLDLKDENSFRDGECINPKLKIVNGTTLIDCDLSNLKGKVKEFYDKGIKEISCGWHGEYEKVEGKDYQYIQRFKDFNHVAILERGRCGDVCSIKDGKEEITNNMDINDEYTVGTVREWQGGKYKKIASGEWERIKEKEEEKTLKTHEMPKDLLSKKFESEGTENKKLENVFYENSKTTLTISQKNRIFNEMPDYFGWEKVYKPYGEKGAGFYYSRIINKIQDDNFGFFDGDGSDKIYEIKIDNRIKDKEIEKGVEDMTKDELDQVIKDTVNLEVKTILDKEKEDEEKKKKEHEENETKKKEEEEEEEKNINDELEKITDKKASIGEIREWKGGKYKKTANGKWERLMSINRREMAEKREKDLEEHMSKVSKRFKEAQSRLNNEKEDEDDLDFPAEGSKEQQEDIRKMKERKTKEKDDEIEDAYLNGEEDEDDLEKAKGKLKKFKDCFAKMKAKKIEVKDEDIVINIEDEKVKIKDEFIADLKGIYEPIEMGILTAKEVTDKLPSEIKAMTIKKVLAKDVDINDRDIVSTLFDLALKNYVNPNWNKKNNIIIQDEDVMKKFEKKLSEINK